MLTVHNFFAGEKNVRQTDVLTGENVQIPHPFG